MTAMELLAVVASALLGGLTGGLVVVLLQLLQRPQPDNNPVPHYRTWADPLNPDLQLQVHDLSAAWAASRGHPEASFPAARYLGDAAEDAQRRWSARR
ncbi:MAG TPA: hypothetical protein VNA57_00105 [Acidimicrobiales bacterium]|nr:hypothetical protein [Acidimicrobiales bacterium]